MLCSCHLFTRLPFEISRHCRPWALCWANESWKATFYGMNRGTSYQQLYTDPRKHAEYLVRVFRSPLYLFIDGRPVLGVYLLSNVPAAYLQALRAWVWRTSGLDMFLLQTSQHYNWVPPYERAHGSDALVEFYPNLAWASETLPPPPCQPKSALMHAHTPTLCLHNQQDVPVWRGGFSGMVLGFRTCEASALRSVFVYPAGHHVSFAASNWLPSCRTQQVGTPPRATQTLLASLQRDLPKMRSVTCRRLLLAQPPPHACTLPCANQEAGVSCSRCLLGTNGERVSTPKGSQRCCQSAEHFFSCCSLPAQKAGAEQFSPSALSWNNRCYAGAQLCRWNGHAASTQRRQINSAPRLSTGC